MKTRNTFMSAVASMGFIMCIVATPAPAVAGDGPAYVGSKTCKKCHSKQFKSWSKTKMGQALATLKPGEASEAKTKFKLDPAKDYTTDTKCLKCHTVGLGLPGGYAIPEAGNKKSVRHAKKLANVGCEACHGPGGEYTKLHKEIMTSGRTYTDEEMFAAGLHKISAETCIKCHNAESPTLTESDVFNFDEMKGKGTHEHFPLKQKSK